MEVVESEKTFKIYPVYFNAKNAGGKRVNLDLCAKGGISPKVQDLSKALNIIGIRHKIEDKKRHPRDPLTMGRILVSVDDSKGYKKRALLKEIGKELANFIPSSSNAESSKGKSSSTLGDSMAASATASVPTPAAPMPYLPKKKSKKRNFLMKVEKVWKKDFPTFCSSLPLPLLDANIPMRTFWSPDASAIITAMSDNSLLGLPLIGNDAESSDPDPIPLLGSKHSLLDLKWYPMSSFSVPGSMCFAAVRRSIPILLHNFDCHFDGCYKRATYLPISHITGEYAQPTCLAFDQMGSSLYAACSGSDTICKYDVSREGLPILCDGFRKPRKKSSSSKNDGLHSSMDVFDGKIVISSFSRRIAVLETNDLEPVIHISGLLADISQVKFISPSLVACLPRNHAKAYIYDIRFIRQTHNPYEQLSLSPEIGHLHSSFTRKSDGNQRLFGDFVSFLGSDDDDVAQGYLMFGQSSGLVSIFDRTRLLSGGQEIEPTFSWMASDDGSPVTSVEARYFGGNSIGIISSHGTRIEMKGRNLTKDDNGSDSEEEGEQDNGNLPPPERCIKLWKLETSLT